MGKMANKMNIKEKAEMTTYIISVLDIANDVLVETPHITAKGVKDTRIAILAICKLIIEADKKR